MSASCTPTRRASLADEAARAAAKRRTHIQWQPVRSSSQAAAGRMSHLASPAQLGQRPKPLGAEAGIGLRRVGSAAAAGGFTPTKAPAKPPMLAGSSKSVWVMPQEAALRRSLHLAATPQRRQSLPSLPPKDASPATSIASASASQPATRSQTAAGGLSRPTSASGVAKGSTATSDSRAGATTESVARRSWLEQRPQSHSRTSLRRFSEPKVTEARGRLDPQRRHSQAMADVLRVQQETMIPMESFRVAISLFKEQSVIQEDDHFQEGFLTKERLGKVLRNMAILDDDVHRAMVEEAFSVADVNGDGLVSFTEFADWFSRHGFRQELNVDPEELQKRQMSRDLGISFLDMDFCKRDFESFDADGNGTIDKDEFYEVLLKCFKVPRHIGLPQRRVQQLWKDADRDGSGTIDFEEFVIFYRKHFIMN